MEKEYRYTLIVSQYYHSYHYFIIKIPKKEELIEKFRKFTLELDAYKGEGKRKELANTGDVFCYDESDKIYRRYNVNANGDIYFLNFVYMNNAQSELRRYYEEQRRYAQGYKKKAVLEDISKNHNYDKVAEIVEKYFKIA